jgi:hypothetical protein
MKKAINRQYRVEIKIWSLINNDIRLCCPHVIMDILGRLNCKLLSENANIMIMYCVLHIWYLTIWFYHATYFCVRMCMHEILKNLKKTHDWIKLVLFPWRKKKAKYLSFYWHWCFFLFVLRFSKLAGKKLQEQNSDIANLSNPYRATKLSEKFSQIYDDEWTNAFEVLTDKKLGLPLKTAIRILLDLLRVMYNTILINIILEILILFYFIKQVFL